MVSYNQIANSLRPKTKKIPVVSTGSLGIDLGLHLGGIPKGRLIEISGPEDSGKSTLGLHILAETQKLNNGTAMFVNLDRNINIQFASMLGIDICNLFVVEPKNAEHLLDICKAVVDQKLIDIIVIDSIGALLSKQEAESDFESGYAVSQTQVIWDFVRKLNRLVAGTDTSVVFINQLRAKYNSGKFVKERQAIADQIFESYCSIRMEIRKTGTIRYENDYIGDHISVDIVRNKLHKPISDIKFDILYGEGISKEREILELGQKFGIVNINWSWVFYNGIRLGQGKENARNFLRNNPDVSIEIENAIRNTYR